MKINRLECVERIVRASHDGTEIVRTFFVDPYEAHEQVLSALMGSAWVDDNGKGIRVKPAHDSYFSNCFCTEAWVDQTAKESMASSPALAQANQNPIDLAGVNWIGDILNQAHQKEVPSGPSTTLVNDVVQNAGCFIRATYKPLIWEDPGERWTEGTIGYTPDPFDFVDPQLMPITKTVSCGVGLRYLIHTKDMPLFYPAVGSEGFCVQPMQQFTIRRIMCPSVPVSTISQLKGRINVGQFDLGKYHFFDSTLRFDDCEVVKRAVPSSSGTFSVWYDLLYVFTWNTTYEEHFTIADPNTGDGNFMPGELRGVEPRARCTMSSDDAPALCAILERRSHCGVGKCGIPAPELLPGRMEKQNHRRVSRAVQLRRRPQQHRPAWFRGPIQPERSLKTPAARRWSQSRRWRLEWQSRSWSSRRRRRGRNRVRGGPKKVGQIALPFLNHNPKVSAQPPWPLPESA